MLNSPIRDLNATTIRDRLGLGHYAPTQRRLKPELPDPTKQLRMAMAARQVERFQRPQGSQW